jgi:hypothetical protein
MHVVTKGVSIDILFEKNRFLLFLAVDSAVLAGFQLKFWTFADKITRL